LERARARAARAVTQARRRHVSMDQERLIQSRPVSLKKCMYGHYDFTKEELE